MGDRVKEEAMKRLKDEKKKVKKKKKKVVGPVVEHEGEHKK